MNQSVPLLRQTRLWIVLALLLGVRLLFACRVVPTPALIQARGGDEPYYVEIAQHLLQVHEYKEGNLVAYRPPAYPAFVAAMLGTGRNHFWCLQLVQNLLFFGSVFLLCAVVSLVWGTRSSLYCGILLLINPVWLMIPQQVLSETLFVFLVALALFFGLRFVKTDKIAWGVLAGVTFGVSALTREIGLYLGIGAVLCLLLKRLTTPVRAMVLIASMFVAILPWTVRNYERLNALVLVDTNGPINLYQGNNPEANGKMRWALPADVLPLWNQPGSEMTVYHRAKTAAWSYVRANPVPTLQRLPAKAWFLWGPIAFADWSRSIDTAFRLFRFVFWIPFALLALYGLATTRNWVTLTIAGWALITTLIHLLTIAQPLYRAPIEFFFAVPAAIALRQLLQAYEGRLALPVVNVAEQPAQVPEFAS